MALGAIVVFMQEMAIFLKRISAGKIKRNIEIYKDRTIHIGVYRLPFLRPDIEDYTNKFVKNNLGPGYGYLKAIILGIRTLLGNNDDKFSPTDVTPNGIIYSGSLYLVGYI